MFEMLDDVGDEEAGAGTARGDDLLDRLETGSAFGRLR